MTFTPCPKTKRIKDKKLIEKISYYPCIICGDELRSPPHHVTGVGAGGDDVESNLMPLCGPHHTEIHKGLVKFVKKHNGALGWLSRHQRVDVLKKIQF